MRFDIVATSVGSAMSVGGVVSGIFGMNLLSPIFQTAPDGWLFLMVVSLILGAIVLIMLAFFFSLFTGRYGFEQARSRLTLRLALQPTSHTKLTSLPVGRYGWTVTAVTAGPLRLAARLTLPDVIVDVACMHASLSHRPRRR